MSHTNEGLLCLTSPNTNWFLDKMVTIRSKRIWTWKKFPNLKFIYFPKWNYSSCACQTLSWSARSSLIYVEATCCLYSIAMPHVVVHMGCITPWLLAHGCVLWQGSLPPLARVWSPRPDLPIVAMTPCHVLSSLGAATSNDIAHMTPHPRTRHCAFMHSIPHHVLS